MYINTLLAKKYFHNCLSYNFWTFAINLLHPLLKMSFWCYILKRYGIFMHTQKICNVYKNNEAKIEQ